MRTYLRLVTVSILLLGGCESGSVGTNLVESESVIVAPATSLDGATFVFIETLSINGAENSPQTTSNRILSFTEDTVTWINSQGTEVGTYFYNNNSNWVANFSDRDIAFSGDDSGLTWESQTFHRATSDQFDSQQSLINSLDGSIYSSVGRFDLGENASGQRVVGQWSILFTGNQLEWAIQDTVIVGTYTFIDGSTFRANFLANEITVVVINNDQLVIDSVLYQREVDSQPDSQQSLISYLDGTSYRSASRLAINQDMEYWYLDFTQNTFSWSHNGLQEVGTYSYKGPNSFTTNLSDVTHPISMDGEEISWQGIRYIKQ